MREDWSIPFRWLPVLRWVNISNHAREACGFGSYDRGEMLQFGWLHFEVDLGVFRIAKA